jgi:peptidoglycan glycosyltransferase
LNRQITKVAVVALILLASLMVATTYWQAYAAPDLADKQDNSIQRVAEFTVKRGEIYAADGRTVLAANKVERAAGQTLYLRRYPSRGLAAHIVGYSTQVRSRAGLERSENDFLTGANANLNTVVETTLDKLRGATVEGNDLYTTIRPGAQRIALNALGGRCGAAVALEPRTGKVLVSVSSPTYDPNLIENDFPAASRPRFGCQPLLNRVTAGLYAPGSIFKVVTGAAALDAGEFTPESTFNDPGYCEEYGKRVENYDTSSPFGNVNLVEAMQYSINSVFCNIGKAIGGIKILQTARKFGFYSVPPLETPVNERSASGLYDKGRPYFPKDDTQVDPGRLAFGQERMLVTPLQMAMVSAAIANGGRVMKPHVVDRIVAPDGTVVVRQKPEELGEAVQPNHARSIAEMMERVVCCGTGGAGKLSVPTAGKTGTAETGIRGRNTTWFIAFAPVENPRVAVAVVLERQSGTGGTTAAPIARQIMQALIG